MAKDDKGNDDKDKKEAGKALEQIRSTFADMRDLHAKLGDHLDNFDKQADARCISRLDIRRHVADQRRIFEIKPESGRRIQIIPGPGLRQG